jgi:hypothetical protein
MLLKKDFGGFSKKDRLKISFLCAILIQGIDLQDSIVARFDSEHFLGNFFNSIDPLRTHIDTVTGPP